MNIPIVVVAIVCIVVVATMTLTIVPETGICPILGFLTTDSLIFPTQQPQSLSRTQSIVDR